LDLSTDLLCVANATPSLGKGVSMTNWQAHLNSLQHCLTSSNDPPAIVIQEVKVFSSWLLEHATHMKMPVPFFGWALRANLSTYSIFNYKVFNFQRQVMGLGHLIGLCGTNKGDISLQCRLYRAAWGGDSPSFTIITTISNTELISCTHRLPNEFPDPCELLCFNCSRLAEEANALETHQALGWFVADPLCEFGLGRVK